MLQRNQINHRHQVRLYNGVFVRASYMLVEFSTTLLRYKRNDKTPFSFRSMPVVRVATLLKHQIPTHFMPGEWKHFIADLTVRANCSLIRQNSLDMVLSLALHIQRLTSNYFNRFTAALHITGYVSSSQEC